MDSFEKYAHKASVLYSLSIPTGILIGGLFSYPEEIGLSFTALLKTHDLLLSVLFVGLFQVIALITSISLEETYVLPPIYTPKNYAEVAEPHREEHRSPEPLTERRENPDDDNEIPSYLRVSGLEEFESEESELAKSRNYKQFFSPKHENHSEFALQASRPISARPNLYGFRFLESEAFSPQDSLEDNYEPVIDRTSENKMNCQNLKHTHISFIGEDYFLPPVTGSAEKCKEFAREYNDLKQSKPVRLALGLRFLTCLGGTMVNETALLVMLVALGTAEAEVLIEVSLVLAGGSLLGYCINEIIMKKTLLKVTVFTATKWALVGLGVMSCVIPVALLMPSDFIVLEYCLVYGVFRGLENMVGTYMCLIVSDSVNFYQKKEIELWGDEVALLGKCIGSICGPMLFALCVSVSVVPVFAVAVLLVVMSLFVLKQAKSEFPRLMVSPYLL